MCGIVGAVAQRNVGPILLEGLRRLEYRGYDSAGLVTVNGGLKRVRSVGRVSSLTAECAAQHAHGHLGIAHTRWATHGAPSKANAHPHISAGLAVVHNGIIENHEALRTRLTGLGFIFTSETDTEVIVHLIELHFRQSRDLLTATRLAYRRRAVAGYRGFGWLCRVRQSQCNCFCSVGLRMNASAPRLSASCSSSGFVYVAV